VHEPVELAVVTLMERAAMVVFELFAGVPVAVIQLPTVMELAASVTVLENCVVDVQLTEVWPVLGFCTSMVVPVMAATLPDAPIGLAAVAAPPADATAVAATIAVAPVPRHRAQRRRTVLPLVGVCIWISLICVVVALRSSGSSWSSYFVWSS
jgi:hypothetical protein